MVKKWKEEPLTTSNIYPLTRFLPKRWRIWKQQTKLKGRRKRSRQPRLQPSTNKKRSTMTSKEPNSQLQLTLFHTLFLGDDGTIYAFQSREGYDCTTMVKIKEDWVQTPLIWLYNKNFNVVKNPINCQRKFSFPTWHNLISPLTATAQEFRNTAS